MAIDWDAMVVGPCISEFGVDPDCVTYISARGGVLKDITGVFDEAYRDPTVLETEPGATSVAPVLGVQPSQFPPLYPPAQNDRVVIKGRTFVVKDVRPDGHGDAKLMLGIVKR